MNLSEASNFPALSIRTLLEARALYHWHLMHKANVIATAIGRYLIRDSDPWPSRENPTTDRARKAAGYKKGPRTLQNSQVREYSWPCVLVFVKSWVAQEEFSTGRYNPAEMVPKTLYLPDGRLVPVCIVEAPLDETAPIPRVRDWEWPDKLLGGGFPVVVDVQNSTHVASAGCLVTDGHTVYALTSRHVVGPEGTRVSSRTRDGLRVVGRSSHKQLLKQDFKALYPEFESMKTLVNLDVGLIEVDDINEWTTQVYGVGAIGPLVDLSTRTISLQLINQEVIAYGAASGSLRGCIKALFYRYATIAGHDLVTDFLIQPIGENPVSSRPGDSGTIWLLVDNDREKKRGETAEAYQARMLPRPIAIQWGGHILGERSENERSAYALATNLSNVCRTLEVDLLRDWNLATTPFWGKLGHYAIGTFAIDALSAAKLKTLMVANRERVSFDVVDLQRKEIDAATRGADFIPLADVPDLVWKARVAGLSRGPSENPTHYADIDEPHSASGQTLMQFSLADPAQNLTVAAWQRFYDEQGHTEPRARGLLPFRVWQFFDALVEFARHGQVAEFVCAAGTLSHYVGDACQTLHGSFLNDGFRDRPLPSPKGKKGAKKAKRWEGKDVHSCYEDMMIDRHADDLAQAIAKHLKALGPAKSHAKSGQDAALMTLELMARAQAKIPPQELVEFYIDAGGKKSVAVADALWDEYGEATAELMADGAHTLAGVWASAWSVGKGSAIAQSKLKAVPEKTLIKLYKDKDFVRSLDLDRIGGILK